ncbi:MAG TPA: alpha-N-acetylglucosaminidase TIM-barrel domain-containing protein [Abditibacteriaceae bacterium]|jgi:alpha-N-acetylglucosaminidase
MKNLSISLLHVLLMVVLWSQTVLAQAPPAKIEMDAQQAAKSEAAVRALMQRLIPRHESKFTLQTIAPDTITGKVMDVIEIESQDGKIVLRGNSTTSLASALNYYLENYASASVAWDGFDQLDLPTPLPDVRPKVRLTSYFPVRVAYQPSTHGYTTAFWNWNRWEHEIDFLALNGFNRALLVQGQEAIWQAVWKEYGYDDAQIRAWLAPPAHAPWHAMGVLENYGGVSQGVIDARLKLAKQIVTRMQELGIEPVLPGYFGIVPPDFKKKKANAEILPQEKWQNQLDRPDYILPETPLFAEVAAKYYGALKNNFNDIKFFWATPFWNGAKIGERTLTKSGQAIYEAMEKAAPEATWVIPAERDDPIASLLVGFQEIEPEEPVDPDAKKEDDAEADANDEDKPKVIDHNRLLLLDTAGDRAPLWVDNSAFSGAPWVWSLQNIEAGQSGLQGDLNVVNRGPITILGNAESGQLKGFGVTADDPRQNFLYWDMLLDNVWRDKENNVGPWIIRFAKRRYGQTDTATERAWALLRESSYSNRNNVVPNTISIRPYFIAPQGKPKDESSQRFKIAQDMGEAWKAMLGAGPNIERGSGAEAYRSDLAAIGTQAMEALAARYMVEIAKAFRARDKEALGTLRDKMLGLMSDMDELMSTRREFMAGAWLDDARKAGTTDAEQKLFEQDARALLTSWSIPTTQRDLAHRNWGGLISNYYEPRWRLWLTALQDSLNSGKPVDDNKVLEQMAAHETEWPKKTNKLPSSPSGDTVKLSKKLWDKYAAEFAKAPQYMSKVVNGKWTTDDVTTDHILWTMDVSQFITKPDEYEVEFKADGGKSSLLIFGVAFMQDGKEIGGKAQNGRTGAYHRENIFKISVKNVSRNKPVTMMVEVATDAGIDTNGTITIRRAERKERL